MSVVPIGLFVSGCLLWFLGDWLALALGNLDRSLAVYFDGCNLHKSDLYEGEVMIYGLIVKCGLGQRQSIGLIIQR